MLASIIELKDETHTVEGIPNQICIEMTARGETSQNTKQNNPEKNNGKEIKYNI